MRSIFVEWLLVFLASSAVSGCLERKLAPLSPCLVTAVKDETTSTRIDKVDLLFMVDNSDSMIEEQASLEDQFPKLIRALTTGDRDGDGKKDFEPATDLHLGVVSSDLGAPGALVSGCSDFGDDGIMNNKPSRDIAGCQASYPRFLTYLGGMNDPIMTAHDFSCIAQLGTGGCGFEQQLESPLKALWPSVDPGAGAGKNRVTFFGDSTSTMLGHGDRENAGFLRNDAEGSSLLAIVVVSDEDDCSSLTTEDIQSLDRQQLGLRCFLHKDALFKTDRYKAAFQALRPQHPELVVFAAIVGVPKDLVDHDARSAVNFHDASQRGSYYQRLLGDPRMTEMPDPAPVTASGSASLVPSCVSVHGKAYPPRRIVQVASDFGENGIVQSVCQEDFGPAMDAIIDLISSKFSSLCVPHPQVRNSDGFVSCTMEWQLPPASTARPGTPTRCDDPSFPFLLPPDKGRKTETPDTHGAICKVAQLKVVDDASAPDKRAPVPTMSDDKMFSDGWYYDNYSSELRTKCKGSPAQRLAFTERATPPNGIKVTLECLDERQSLSGQRADVSTGTVQATIGSACGDAVPDATSADRDLACEVRLSAPSAQFPESVDRRMFCHPKLNLCVLPCATDTDCPAAWVCDDRSTTLMETVSGLHASGSAICVNPTCGEVR